MDVITFDWSILNPWHFSSTFCQYYGDYQEFRNIYLSISKVRPFEMYWNFAIVLCCVSSSLIEYLEQ